MDYQAKVTIENEDGSEQIIMFAKRDENDLDKVGISVVSNEKLADRDPLTYDFEKGDLHIALSQAIMDALGIEAAQ